jgi:hypothetical protein
VGKEGKEMIKVVIKVSDQQDYSIAEVAIDPQGEDRLDLMDRIVDDLTSFLVSPIVQYSNARIMDMVKHKSTGERQ